MPHNVPGRRAIHRLLAEDRRVAQSLAERAQAARERQDAIRLRWQGIRERADALLGANWQAVIEQEVQAGRDQAARFHDPLPVETWLDHAQTILNRMEPGERLGAALGDIPRHAVRGQWRDLGYTTEGVRVQIGPVVSTPAPRHALPPV